MTPVDTEETGRCTFCALPNKRLFKIMADDDRYAIVNNLCKRCVDIMMPKEGEKPR